MFAKKTFGLSWLDDSSCCTQSHDLAPLINIIQVPGIIIIIIMCKMKTTWCIYVEIEWLILDKFM